MRNRFSLRVFPLVIGSAHLLLLASCLYERIWELIELAEPFLLRDNIFILTSYVTQILSVFVLIIGVVTEKLIFTLPWLLLSTALFSSGTIFAVTNLSFEDFNQTVINIIVVSVIWTAWYIILEYNLENNECLANILNYMRRYRRVPSDTCDSLE